MAEGIRVRAIPYIRYDKIRWGYKIIDDQPYLDDEGNRYTDAPALYWDTDEKVIIEVLW